MNKRIFIAINFDASFLKNDLEKIKEELENEPIKWVEMGNIHLTILFIGSKPVEKIGLVERAIDKNIGGIPPFKMTLKSLGIFSGVLWVGVDMLRGDHTIKKELEKNFDIKHQGFSPHITLGRFKGEINEKKIYNLIKKYKNHIFGSATVKSMDLMESVLNHVGPKYKVLKKFEL